MSGLFLLFHEYFNFMLQIKFVPGLFEIKLVWS